VLLTVDAGAGSEKEPISAVMSGSLQQMVVHQYTRCKSANIFKLNVVDTADACGQMKDVVHSIGGTPTANFGRQVNRSEFDIVFVRFNMLDATTGEVVGDNYVAVFLQ
jgi:hypothetical protein